MEDSGEQPASDEEELKSAERSEAAEQGLAEGEDFQVSEAGFAGIPTIAMLVYRTFYIGSELEADKVSNGTIAKRIKTPMFEHFAGGATKTVAGKRGLVGTGYVRAYFIAKKEKIGQYAAKSEVRETQGLSKLRRGKNQAITRADQANWLIASQGSSAEARHSKVRVKASGTKVKLTAAERANGEAAILNSKTGLREAVIEGQHGES